MGVQSVKPYLLTAVGKKFLMGLTGLVWIGFVFAHMAGNFLLYVGADAYNSYSHALTSGKIILVAEAALVISLLIHIICAVSLTLENKKARGGQSYAMAPNGDKGVSVASRTMAIHGLTILVFVITHLIGFKYGTYYETKVDGVVMRDIYKLVVEVFKNPGAVMWYMVALVLLGLHLSHGVGSIFQSLGLKNQKYDGLIKKISLIYSLVVALGFIAQPLYVFFIAG